MIPRTAVLYARVSSREQQQEGYSIEAQVKLLRAAASREGIEIVREFIEVESAKAAGRKQFSEMVAFFNAQSFLPDSAGREDRQALSELPRCRHA